MLRGTTWTLEGLIERDDLNGAIVTAVNELDSQTNRIRVVTNVGQHVRVRTERLRSRNDPQVNAKMFLDAANHIRESAKHDNDMAAFLGKWERGDHEGALSAASSWILKA